MSAEELNNTGAEEPMFAGLKKKSKKAKVNFDDADFMNQDAPTTAADAATATISEAEKKIDAGEEGGVPVDAPAADDGADMFADLKKKSKKKKKEIPLDLVSTNSHSLITDRRLTTWAAFRFPGSVYPRGCHPDRRDYR